ncbi:DASH complex subunit DAM1 [Colletotrichum tanaceti]|uniref:DASH complex subunit DAM1 n=1 Tax=Colletotrichum tanaceti TaxID=1306861 RepID=A0A4U6XVK8_9PEZI|nr:DASH complex subunit DAM1 [Colletotrichum tanaceti]
MADHNYNPDLNPSNKRSTSRMRNSHPTTPMRPTTPLRPSSRSSLRESARDSVHGGGESFPLNTFEPAFAELSDAVADLEANMMHFQLMHESLARFSESFASFLYGLNMNAFCVDFQEDYGCFFCRKPTCLLQADPEIQDPYYKRITRACAGHPRYDNAGPRRRPWRFRDT